MDDYNYNMFVKAFNADEVSLEEDLIVDHIESILDQLDKVTDNTKRIDIVANFFTIFYLNLCEDIDSALSLKREIDLQVRNKIRRIDQKMSKV